MNTAEQIIGRLNPNALAGEIDGCTVMIEDVTDPDGRIYRLEYCATADGRRAVAYCRFNPWGEAGQPDAGESYEDGHVMENGFLCLGDDAVRELGKSPYDLEFTIKRARYWCTGFSVLKETGEFPNP